jgi:hypothetical protein
LRKGRPFGAGRTPPGAKNGCRRPRQTIAWIANATKSVRKSLHKRVAPHRTAQNKTKQNKTKQNKTKQNKTKQNILLKINNLQKSSKKYGAAFFPCGM